jgi:1-deoxy-D-xylulose-5-phosphate synthase
LHEDQLPELALEIREFLIDSVSKTGGHIAPSLGVVELTLALHYLFETPHDKFVWDVGHQAYTHKIITGRRDRFSTLRKYRGLSGFPHITESIHDAFTVGHASTSISAALGMAQARDRKNETGEVISIIGDGAMTGGLAYEGLNNLGHSNTKMIVILNDNEMSIAPNVGGMSNYLTRIITDKRYTKLKSNVWNALDQIPRNLGKRLQSLGHTIDENLKKAFTPGKLFEDMGIQYLGPIDGHNLQDLFHVLTYAKEEARGPLLIHVLTKKGKGYDHAENNATKFHGIGSFHVESGELRSADKASPSWSKVFGEALLEIAQKDSTVTAITAAMPSGTGLDEFEKRLPAQFVDVGIAEQHGATYSAGLAVRGLKPVFALYSSFMQRAYDQVIHDVALDNLDVVFCVDRAGIVGADGPTHHGAFDISFLYHIPNLTILSPSCGEDLRQMLYSALYEIPGPVVIRYPRGTVGAPARRPFQKISEFPPELKVDTGGDTLILSVGDFLESAKQTAGLLHEKDISCDVADLRSLKPLHEKELSTYLSRYSTIVVMENNARINGMGAQVLSCANQMLLANTISRIPRIIPFAYPDYFIEQGSVDELRSEMGLIPSRMAAKIIAYRETSPQA